MLPVSIAIAFEYPSILTKKKSSLSGIVGVIIRGRRKKNLYNNN